LSETTLLILKNSKHEDLDDIELSLTTIKDRSESLLTFMEDYRKLIKIPQPKPEIFDVQNSINGIIHLFQGQLEEVDVKETYENKEIYADPILLEQVLVNLLTNSIQALEATKNKSIEIDYQIDDLWMNLSLRDNGRGMDQEVLSKALIPFYTTKNTGSGIGLSLVKQIVNLHRGRVEIESVSNEFTQIKLSFPVVNSHTHES